MISSKQGFFLKLTLTFLIIIAGALSFLKEVTSSRVVEIEQPKPTTVLSETSQDIRQNQILSNEIIPLTVGDQKDFSVRVPILMYHYVRNGMSVTDGLRYDLSISPAVLDQQLTYIAQNGYQTISLTDLYDALENRSPLPPKSVILTFDDGFRDFYTNAFPLLKKHNLRAVSFYVAGYSNYPNYMNWDMVKEIHDSGLVDVQSHTMSHLMLTKLPTDQAIIEITQSKQLIEDKLGKRVNYFAYPYGDYNQQIIEFVQKAGYRLAFGTLPSFSQSQSQEYFLNRIAVNGRDTFEDFIAKLGR